MIPTRRLFSACAITALVAAAHGCERARAQTPIGTAATTPAPKYRVSLATDGLEEPLRNRLRSWLSRDLRRLDDIEVTDEQPMFILHIVGFTVPVNDQTDAPYAVAVAVTRKVWVSDAPADFPDEEAFVAWELLFSDLPQEFLRLTLYTGSADRLENTCEQIAADFDAGQMKAVREFRGKYHAK
jgi:hypothetical protein